MHEYLFEGIRDVALPCALTLWLPVLLIALIARRRAGAAALAAWTSASVLTWGRAIGWPAAGDAWWWGIIAALVLIGAAWLVWPMRFGRTLGGGTLAGAVSVWLWQPCVGPQLAEILNTGQGDPWGVAIPTVLYVGGALAAVWLVLAVRAALRPSTRFEEPLAKVGWALTVVLAAAVAVGLYDDIAGTLYRWSL